MSENNFHKHPTIPPSFSEGTSSDKAIEIPKQIGPYKIESLLNKGGMSLLYLGTHPETKDPITIKVLLPKFISHPEITRHFLNEAEIIALADHPNIIKLFGYGDWEGGLYIAMEFIEGVSLRQYLLQSPLSLKRALELTLEIAYALCHLHTHGVIHRDLKPENILVTKEGQIKVIDFGIAQLLDNRDIDSNQEGRLIGTPVYMSPEQRKNPQSVSYPSDIYSLGIIAYELVLGKLSHGQVHLSLMPRGLQKILTKTLQPEIQNRYQDIVDFISDLTAYLYSSELEKDKRAGDQANEFFEKMKDIQNTFILPPMPNISYLEIGLAVHQPQGRLSGIYYDFIPFGDDSFTILLAQSSIAGGEGVIFSAILSGMIKALSKTVANPLDLLKVLNESLAEEKKDSVIPLSYLIFYPKENNLSYISCGYGNLWIIPNDTSVPKQIVSRNVALGIEPTPPADVTTIPWNSGERLILSSLVLSPQLFPEEHFKRILQDQSSQPPQRQVENILRRAKAMYPKYFDIHPAIFLSIQRK